MRFKGWGRVEGGIGGIVYIGVGWIWYRVEGVVRVRGEI